MYINVVLGVSPDDTSGYSSLIVNPNCPIGIIYDFIKESLGIPAERNFDLCDETANLIFIQDKEPWERGTNYLQPRSVYFVVFFEKDENGKPINSILNIPPEFGNSDAKIYEMQKKINKQLHISTSSKNGRITGTRSASVSNCR